MTSQVVNSCRYAVFTLTSDSVENSIPIGVALWSPEHMCVIVRFIDATAQRLPFVDLVCEKITQWIDMRNLPYAHGNLTPWQEDWWQHVRKLLIHRVRLSEPRSVNCRDPENGFQTLFEFLVARQTSEFTQ